MMWSLCAPLAIAIVSALLDGTMQRSGHEERPLSGREAFA